MKYIALIPAYNPDDKIEELVKRLLENDFETVVVDDGSKEECQIHFENIKDYCHVIHHEGNKGKGRALKTGLTYITENYEKYVVVTLDCDGQHTMKDALRLCDYCSHHQNVLTLGSRKFDTNNVPLRSRFGNMVTRFVYFISTKTKVFDTQTGLRAFSSNLVDPMLEIEGERFEYEINVLLYFSKNRIPIKELTIKTIYLDNNSSSHFNPIKDSFKIYQEILKFSLSSICSFLIDIILYSIFLFAFGSFALKVQISNVLARIFSATFNFTMNRKFVFQKKNDLKKSILSYIALALFILVMNTCLLSILVSFGVQNIIAKVITEIILFIVSFFIQHVFVFRGDDNV
ncbi:MAG: bifunctional glycosyltransferase family 2/GtrA family protein [Bacilli bacterium]|nr:bifunctional glycosyltransferase family 2/GtrA family protein [Bacilli bacterium]